jgi:hypothetical protein
MYHAAAAAGRSTVRNSRVLESRNVVVAIGLGGVVRCTGCSDSNGEEDKDGLHVYD